MKWPADRITHSSKKSYGLYEQAQHLSAQGIDLIHLGIGRPNFDTPTHIKKATIKALQDGVVHYGDFAGDLEFRRAIAKKVSAENQILVDCEEIIVVNGLSQGAYASCMAALDPGDEVIFLDPYYPQHINRVELTGAIPVFVALDSENEFALDCHAIENKITTKTKMIILVNPANPTGRAYSQSELQSLADLAIKYDLLVVSDEVYEKILYEDAKHTSIASIDGMKSRTITLFAFTKIYAMDGWRLGYIVADKAMIPDLLKITTNESTHVNVFIQAGGLSAIISSDDCVEQMVREDKRRRDLVVNRLNAMPQVSCANPNATIYAFPNISATGLSSDLVAKNILEQCHVVVESGAFYGANGEGYLRLCFGAEEYSRLELAMDRLDVFFKQANSQRT